MFELVNKEAKIHENEWDETKTSKKLLHTRTIHHAGLRSKVDGDFCGTQSGIEIFKIIARRFTENW